MGEIRFCKKHGYTEFTLDSHNNWRCKKCRSEAVQKRREKLKLMAIEYKGGKCEICGYNKCPDALEFHHVNPEEKEFGIGQKGYTRSFDDVKKELDKCLLVCSNCHREIHYKSRSKQTEQIIEEIKQEKNKKEQQHTIINVTKEKHTIPSKEEVIEVLVKFKNFRKTGIFFKRTDNAVRKWCRKYNIPTHTDEMLLYLHNIGRLP